MPRSAASCRAEASGPLLPAERTAGEELYHVGSQESGGRRQGLTWTCATAMGGAAATGPHGATATGEPI